MVETFSLSHFAIFWLETESVRRWVSDHCWNSFLTLRDTLYTSVASSPQHFFPFLPPMLLFSYLISMFHFSKLPLCIWQLYDSLTVPVIASLISCLFLLPSLSAPSSQNPFKPLMFQEVSRRRALFCHFWTLVCATRFLNLFLSLLCLFGFRRLFT